MHTLPYGLCESVLQNTINVMGLSRLLIRPTMEYDDSELTCLSNIMYLKEQPPEYKGGANGEFFEFNFTTTTHSEYGGDWRRYSDSIMVNKITITVLDISRRVTVAGFHKTSIKSVVRADPWPNLRRFLFPLCTRSLLRMAP
jgi:hypothetical protein